MRSGVKNLENITVVRKHVRYVHTFDGGRANLFFSVDHQLANHVKLKVYLVYFHVLSRGTESRVREDEGSAALDCGAIVHGFVGEVLKPT